MFILTGGAGFIGSAFLARLNQEGIDDVLVVDELGCSEKWKNLVGKRFVDYVHKDSFIELLDSDSFGRDVDVVVHMGACSSTTEQDAEYMLDNNYRYSRTLAEWCLEHKVRFIYASSAATYGDGSLGFSDAPATVPMLRPLNVYAFSKQLFDLWVLDSGAAEEVAGLKFFNVFGPNEYHKGDMRSVVVKAFEQIRESKRLRLFKSYKAQYADGEQKRDFVYVKDCNEVLWWFIEHPKVAGIYNVGSGKARSWNDLARAVFSAMNLETAIEYIDMPENLRAKYQYFTEADLNGLRQVGCNCEFSSLEDGVSDYVRNYLLRDSACL